MRSTWPARPGMGNTEGVRVAEEGSSQSCSCCSRHSRIAPPPSPREQGPVTKHSAHGQHIRGSVLVALAASTGPASHPGFFTAACCCAEAASSPTAATDIAAQQVGLPAWGQAAACSRRMQEWQQGEISSRMVFPKGPCSDTHAASSRSKIGRAVSCQRVSTCMHMSREGPGHYSLVAVRRSS